MRFLTTFILSAFTAVAMALPARAQQPLEGAWRLTQLNGQDPAAASANGNVVLSGLEFQADGRLSATFSTARNDGAQETANFPGTWNVEGDSLTLYLDMGASEDDGDEPVTVWFAVRDGQLLITADAMEYAFARATPGAAPATAAPVEGSYELVQINGDALPAPSPTEDDVMMHKAALALMPDGRFVMQAMASAGDDAERRPAEAWGRWVVTGDALSLTPDEGGDDDALHFHWTLEGGTLTLVDEEGHAYTFRRR